MGGVNKLGNCQAGRAEDFPPLLSSEDKPELHLLCPAVQKTCQGHQKEEAVKEAEKEPSINSLCEELTGLFWETLHAQSLRIGCPLCECLMGS